MVLERRRKKNKIRPSYFFYLVFMFSCLLSFLLIKEIKYERIQLWFAYI